MSPRQEAAAKLREALGLLEALRSFAGNANFPEFDRAWDVAHADAVVAAQKYSLAPF